MILALETSTSMGSVALYDPAESRMVWEQSFRSERSHNALIFRPLREVLRECGGCLERVVVGTGPGSYSGIRVAIAVAGGLGVALGVPVAGGSSLEAFAPEGESCLVVGDARRESFFAAKVVAGGESEDPILLDEQGLKEAIVEACGFGWPVFSADATLWERRRESGISEGYPTAGRLARRWARLSRECFEERSNVPLEPHYLRAPYITTPK
ncbi:MAG: tRNA (adenosine(37)-N6)-threonylcarbamoyltransferase complex dimerization subunit type 1 TsaB [Verrucomicrobiales bacterium]|nr:tRNA (adenosine(37)-N6)-threonylcarbamoyltransferase complex dimerization subunit type 1 TsaB [Verrucomicrobiales bacterium]